MRARYGASPVHLLAHLILLPIVGWALLTVLDFRAASNVVAVVRRRGRSCTT